MIETISALLEHAENAMKFVNKGGAFLDAATPVLKRLRANDGDGNVTIDEPTRDGIIALGEELMAAKLANLELKSELYALKEAALEMQKQQDRFIGYTLWETPAGQHIYRREEQDGEPSHYICPTCRDAGRKSILQGNAEVVFCHPCQQGFRLRPSRPIARSKSSYRDGF
ncbi:hypothetical protein [Oceaniradius stylonematis]|uniref:hypothetical protein n=1 Tax=Oceaniradius stylonematis TaxID=2184161 RepID=UPI00273D6232|nr:hypothetical protein [Oceaniradius stylonematis]